MNDGRDLLETALRGTDHDRLLAARAISRTPDAALKSGVRRALKLETVPWVSRALEKALEAIEAHSATEPPPPLETPPVDPEAELERRQIYADALHETSEVLLHEITTVVGRARYAAERELPDDNTLRLELALLGNICEGIEALAGATDIPHSVEVELSTALRDLAAREASVADVPIRTRGSAPFIVSVDRGLLEIALRNVLVNAVEATAELVSEAATTRPVVVSWGTDEECHWIAVIDRGPGRPPGGDIFRLGATTKTNHPGLGLTAARQAMRSLGGDVSLDENEGGGITALLRWPKHGASD